MHYFIFPDTDTTLYSASSSKNSGLDEIFNLNELNYNNFTYQAVIH